MRVVGTSAQCGAAKPVEAPRLVDALAWTAAVVGRLYHSGPVAGIAQ
jgi:hypothetical protein